MTASLVQKRIVVAITGGISAYKSAYLVRNLILIGAEVRVVMTKAAQQFISPLTFQTLSKQKVLTDDFADAENSMSHIEIAKWAEFIIIAPATADFIAKLAHGLADDLLSTMCLASSAPIAIAPAMNQQMFAKKVVQDNITTVRQNSVLVFGPASGLQACGDVGEGRMLEPDEITKLIAQHFSSGLLADKTIVITAGPTREFIDPMRYLSNRSSGKMAYALAQVAVDLGADVKLVSGVVDIAPPQNAKLTKVNTASQMLDETLGLIKNADWMIACAAVADYRPKTISTTKIKKSDEVINLELIANPDIVKTVANHTNRPNLVVGFAAETDNINENAKIKLKAKNLDIIIANDIAESVASEENKVNIIWQDGNNKLAKSHKNNIARQILQFLASFENAQNST